MENPTGVFVTFYTDAVELKYESEKQGRPIFKDVAFIRKMAPGDANNIVERVAKDFDKKQFPRQWAEYEATNKSGEVIGTPLEQWPQITRAQVKELKYLECHTVEQLSEMSDGNLLKMGAGFRPLRDSARKWLDGLNAAKVDEEKEALKKQVAELSETVAEIKRGPGRPKKDE